jgi:apolipoprotein N-acyltransferase
VHGAFSIAEVARTQEHRPKLRIGVVQAAIAPTRRWDPEARDDIVAELRLLTVQSERRGAALTLWPEAAYPHGVAHARSRMPRGPRAIVGGAVRGPVLTGALTQPAGVIGRHNAAILVRPDGFIQMPQAKLALLWFGESVPFGEYLPSLRRAFSRTGGLVPGHEVALLSHGPARIGVLNCYEDTLPGISRHIARAEPNLLVNLTNDAWFAPSSETELHLRLSALRAVETRRDLLRAVNLGLPAWIDSAGRIRALGKAERKSVLVVDVALNDESPTLYTKVGDVVAWLALGLATAAAWLWSRRRARQPATAPGLLDSSKRSRGPSYSPASPE